MCTAVICSRLGTWEGKWLFIARLSNGNNSISKANIFVCFLLWRLCHVLVFIVFGARIWRTIKCYKVLSLLVGDWVERISAEKNVTTLSSKTLTSRGMTLQKKSRAKEVKRIISRYFVYVSVISSISNCFKCTF